MLTAQDYLAKNCSGQMRGGFNARLQGEDFLTAMEHVPQGYEWGQRCAGWEAAEKLISDGKIFSVFRFDYLDRRTLWPEWWVIKIYKDGNEWCCVGESFENIQESQNFAFGDTKDESLCNYKAKMLGITAS
jgi:hypothetical protein